MSTRSATRKRPQKHQNAKGWKVDKFHTDEKTKIVQNLVVTNCCEKCTGVIEWKIRYGKYKPLSQPAKCTRCHEKRIKSAYHTICTPCVKEFDVCAKCNQKETEIVNGPRPTASEEACLQSDLQKELKALPERKRRTFLRYLRKQEEGITGVSKKSNKQAEEEEEAFGDDGDDAVAVEDEATKKAAGANALQLNSMRKDALEKLKGLTEKYGKKDDDFDDFDLEDLDDLDLSDEEDEDDE